MEEKERLRWVERRFVCLVSATTGLACFGGASEVTMARGGWGVGEEGGGVKGCRVCVRRCV